MNQQSQQHIREYLQQTETQTRIWKSIQEAKSNMSVTISQAARLFHFSESQLREWEKRGLLQTERPLLSQESKGSTGHRQYSPAELDKLAVIRDLINHGYTPGDIPTDIDKIWLDIIGEDLTTIPGQGYTSQALGASSAEHYPLDRRVEITERQEFWRYFVSQALRISLMLICQDIPDTTVAGLVLPLQNAQFARRVKTTADLQKVGSSLLGWQENERSFSAFLEPEPAFEYPSDFRLETLFPPDAEVEPGDRVLENVFIIVQRRSRPFSHAPQLVGAIRRMLSLVYAHSNDWRSCFDYGRRDWLYQTPNLTGIREHTLFHNLVEQVIEAGGTTADGRNRWSFCALLLPEVGDTTLPIQQQGLVVRAQTRQSPYEVGVTAIPPEEPNNLSLKAFQSGQIVSLANTLPGESLLHTLHPPVITRGRTNLGVLSTTTAQTVTEASTRSAIALPMVGDYSLSTAVLYIASEEPDAFSLEDQRVLRMLSQMIEELVVTSRARSRLSGKWAALIDTPAVVDETFSEFALETEFISDIEALLSELTQTVTGQRLKEELSIVSVDIDQHSSIAIKYGNRVARNLSQQVGARINAGVRLADGLTSKKVFHVAADRYYLLFDNFQLEAAQNWARQLKNALTIEYRINPSYAIPGRPVQPESRLELSGITVHMSVSSYPLEKLQELSGRYPAETAAMHVRALILEGIEAGLARGVNLGGNCIVTWDRNAWDYKVLE
jgi:GGDEF domain-containing protein